MHVYWKNLAQVNVNQKKSFYKTKVNIKIKENTREIHLEKCSKHVESFVRNKRQIKCLT